MIAVFSAKIMTQPYWLITDSTCEKYTRTQGSGWFHGTSTIVGYLMPNPSSYI